MPDARQESTFHKQLTNKINYILPLPFFMAGAIAFSVQYGISQNDDYFYPAIATTMLSASLVQAFLRFSNYHIANQWFDYIKYDLFFYRIILMIFITPKLCTTSQSGAIPNCFNLNFARNIHAALELGFSGVDYIYFMLSKYKKTIISVLSHTLSVGSHESSHNRVASEKSSNNDIAYFNWPSIVLGVTMGGLIISDTIFQHIENDESRSMARESASLITLTYLIYSLLSPAHSLLKTIDKDSIYSALSNKFFVAHKISPLWISFLLRTENIGAICYAAFCIAVVSISKAKDTKDKRIEFRQSNIPLPTFNRRQYLAEALKTLIIALLPVCTHVITNSKPMTIAATAGVGSYFTAFLLTIFMSQCNITRSPSLNELLIASLISYFNAVYFRSLNTGTNTSDAQIASTVISALIGLLWGIDSAHKTPWGAQKILQNAATGETTAFIRNIIILTFTARLGMSDNNAMNGPQPQP